MKFLGLILLFSSTLSYAVKPFSGLATKCDKPKTLIDYTHINKQSPDYLRCEHLYHETGIKECCVDAAPAECRPPHTRVDMATVPQHSPAHDVCKQQYVLTRSKMCCVDPSLLIPNCGKPTVLTDLSSITNKSAYKTCKMNLIKNTNKCCIDPRTINHLEPIKHETIRDDEVLQVNPAPPVKGIREIQDSQMQMKKKVE